MNGLKFKKVNDQTENNFSVNIYGADCLPCGSRCLTSGKKSKKTVELPGTKSRNDVFPNQTTFYPTSF
jgi:hypothetical protein